MKSGTITSIFIKSGITQTEGDRTLIDGLAKEKEPSASRELLRPFMYGITGREL